MLSIAGAQTHPGMEGMQMPPSAKADFYFSQGKFKESLEIYKTLQKEGADSSYIFRNMVKAWNKLDALDEAENYLNEYLTMHENSSAGFYALGFLNYVKGELLKSEELFKQATTLDPDNSLAWNNWAASLSDRKQFQEAVKKIKIAIRINPKELMFFFNLKKVYKELGEEQRFEAEFNKILQADGKKAAWGYGKVLARTMRQKAFREYGKDNLAGAISGFEQILDIYIRLDDLKGQVPILFSLGLLHEEDGDVQKGREYFGQVLAINPDHIQAREKMGSVK